MTLDISDEVRSTETVKLPWSGYNASITKSA